MTSKQRFTILAAAIATVLSISARTASAEEPECTGLQYFCLGDDSGCIADATSYCEDKAVSYCRNNPSVTSAYCWIDGCPSGYQLWCNFGAN